MLAKVVDLAGSIAVTTVEHERALVRLLDEDGGSSRGPILTVKGIPAMRLSASFKIRPDSAGQYIAVTSSAFALSSVLERSPLFRLDFDDDRRAVPSGHWQVHAERGALSNVLTLSGNARPHALSALHLPVGGSRLRPCLEDFLQFAIDQCGVDAVNDYSSALNAGRQKWRRRQIAAAVRDVPEEAVRVLRQLGYDISEPPDGPAPVRAESLTSW